MKQFILHALGVFLVFCLSGNCHAQHFENVQRFGSPSGDVVFKTIAGQNGSYYVAGQTTQDSVLGIQPIFITLCTFVAKFDSTGSPVWVQKSFNLPSGNITAMVLDEDENLYVTGNLSSSTLLFTSLGLSTATVPNPNSKPGMFIVKFNSSGSGIWGKGFFGTGDINPTSITVNQGNVLVAGSFTRVAPFNYYSVVSTGYPDADGKYPSDGFIVKVSPVDGMAQWAKRVGAPNESDGIGAIATDAAGNFYFTAHVEQNSTFDTLQLNNYANQRLLLTKCTPAGAVTWTKLISATNPNGYTTLATDAPGNVYLLASGAYEATVLLGGLTYEVTLENGYNFIAKFNTSGTPEWVKPAGRAAASMCLDGQGNVFIGGTLSGFPNALAYPGHQVTVLGDYDICLLKFSNSGALRWIRTAGGSAKEMLRSICATTNGKVINAGVFQGTANLDGTEIESVGNYDIFVARLVDGSATTVKGSVFIDSNSNGTWDSNEAPAQGVIVALKPTKGQGNTNSAGKFQVYTVPGSYEVQIPFPPLYHTISTSVPTAFIAGFGQSDTLAPIGIAPIPGIKHVEVDLSPTGAFRPGFNGQYLLTYHNIGTAAISSTIRLVADSVLQFLSSVPAHSTVSGNVVEWEFLNLQPGEARQIKVNFAIPASVPLNTWLQSEVYVSYHLGYENPEYRHFTFENIVTGSYDPNDKQVQPSGPITPQQVEKQDALVYTIRFQNTGTDTAFTVLIRDYLTEMLEPASIQTIAASHSYSFALNSEGVAEWKFENILLPDSGRNQLGSNGFVKFRIRPKSTLQLSDIIANTGLIYFDFNEAVVTNTTQTVVKNPPKNEQLSDPFTVFPNPGTGQLTVVATMAADSEVRVICINTAGKVVDTRSVTFQAGNSKQQIHYHNLPQGLYFLQFIGNGKSVSKKLVIQSK